MTMLGEAGCVGNKALCVYRANIMPLITTAGCTWVASAHLPQAVLGTVFGSVALMWAVWGLWGRLMQGLFRAKKLGKLFNYIF